MPRPPLQPHPLVRSLTLFALAALAFSSPPLPAHGQQRAVARQVVVEAADYDAFTFVRPALEASKRQAATQATIRVSYAAGVPAAARTAFDYAAQIWESHLESDVPIDVEVAWEDLGTTTLGSAGPTFIYADDPSDRPSQRLPELPRKRVWYNAALAEAIVGRDLSDGDADIAATFNSGFDRWYYGTDGRPPAGQYDFVTVVLHELGHGLGFFGSLNYDDGEAEVECSGEAGIGCWGFGNPEWPLIYDTFVYLDEGATDVAVLDESRFPNPSTALGDALISDALVFDGPGALGANDEIPVDLYAPSNFEPGSSFSHLDERAFPPGSRSSLMTPQIGAAEAIHDPGPATCGLLADLGWTLGEACLVALGEDPEPPPPDFELGVAAAYPNPFATATRIPVTVDARERVRVVLFDALGREVATLLDVVASGETVFAEIDGVGLAAGVYFVRVEGESFVETRQVVRLR